MDIGRQFERRGADRRHRGNQTVLSFSGGFATGQDGKLGVGLVDWAQPGSSA
jgi:hypothetical protein